ncbi:MAG: LytTR family DNA-binding domain-containing protein [Muribaculaceae bacterium]|nr:LytTR family DNA-binding domain-containing protein [Muribaculaceae bacterium]
MTLNCIIIDDEPLARELLKSYVARTPGLSLAGDYESAADAIRAVTGGEAELILLDIDMPMLNGIEFATLIPSSCRIIYVTAYEQYALQGFRVNALDYLLKPVSYPEFMRAITKALDWKRMYDAYHSRQPSQDSDLTSAVTQAQDNIAGSSVCTDNGLITVRTDYRLIQLRLDTILYVEVRKDRVIFFRSEGEPISSLMTLSDLETHLPADRFMRVHRSYIVNLTRIEVVERSRIVFGKTYIPISASRREEFLARLRPI